jgi:hypothetical protein
LVFITPSAALSTARLTISISLLPSRIALDGLVISGRLRSKRRYQLLLFTDNHLSSQGISANFHRKGSKGFASLRPNDPCREPRVANLDDIAFLELPLPSRHDLHPCPQINRLRLERRAAVIHSATMAVFSRAKSSQRNCNIGLRSASS